MSVRRWGAERALAIDINAIAKLYCDGAMLVGDSAGMLNIMKLAGIHTAMKSGMMAAETIIDGIKAADFSAQYRELKRSGAHVIVLFCQASDAGPSGGERRWPRGTVRAAIARRTAQRGMARYGTARSSAQRSRPPLIS